MWPFPTWTFWVATRLFAGINSEARCSMHSTTSFQECMAAFNSRATESI
jgi:hypothetical protein